MFKTFLRIGLRNLWKQRLPRDIHIIGLSIAIVILLTVAFLTLNIQILRVKKMNPAETLRTE